MRFFRLPLLLLAATLAAQNRTSSCSRCPVWNEPQPAFKIFGNTWYVGTHGLGTILITSDAGHILIDGALPESAPLIAANIRSLGFRLEDVKLILNTHVHFDHAGAIPELQRLTGARVALSAWSASVLRKGVVPRDDPQFGLIQPVVRVARVESFADGATLSVGSASVTTHPTPGHTPGGTSFTWRACEGERCLNLVYADSLTAVSRDGFKFSRRAKDPHGEDFERSFAVIGSAPCDILITPHPEFSNLWERLEKRSTNPDALIDRSGCRTLVESSREGLRKRLASEK